jgi:RimJ/RimL family protein N-acetyltransferase
MTHHWPLFDLRLRTERLELRLPTDDDLCSLAEVAVAGVHGPDEMPFCTPWTRQPAEDLRPEFLRHHWRHRAGWSPDDWWFEAAVVHDGQPIGTQALGASQFGITRTARSGSWLGQAHHGHGFGTEMRAAVLALAFEHLGAVRAESGYLDGNDSSMGVSRSLGYQSDGTRIQVVEGRRRVEQRLVIDIDTWRSRPRPHVEVDGLDGCREMFGATS